jgi:hypothetical protein
MADLKLYVLVRRDLPWSVRCVQSIHAALALYEHDAASAQLPVVLIGIENEERLSGWYRRLDQVAYGFHEPDIGDQLTAIAFVSSSLPELSELQLL